MTQKVAAKAPETNSAHLRTPQRRRRGFLLFVSLSLVLVIGIGLTFLLANNGRNLHLLSGRLEGIWPSLSFHRAADIPTAPLPRGGRLSSPKVSLPSRVFIVPPLMDMGAFVRTIPFPGKTFCDKMNAAGLRNSGWAQNPYNPKLFDCTVEAAVTPADENADAPSFFMTARGNEAGQIMQIRWKIIDVKNNPKIWALYLASIDSVASISGWSDFSPQFDSMRALQLFDVNHFGLSFTFTKESDGAARYNIMLMPENEGSLQRNTRTILNSRSIFSSPPLLKTMWPRQRLW